MIRSQHLKLIASHSARHGIRGGAGLVSIFMTLVTGLMLSYCVVAPLEMMDATRSEFDRQFEKQSNLDPTMRAEIAAQKAELEAQMVERVNSEVKKIARKAIDWGVDPSEEQLKFLTDDHPALISAFLVLLMLFTPFLTCLSGFNQTSSDIDSKGLRFLLIRTERSNIFLGRLIGTYLFTMVVFGILFAILGLYFGLSVKVHEPGAMIAWLAQGYLRVMIFVLPYMALCAWVSCAISSSFGSLSIGLLVVYMYPVLIYLGTKIQPVIGYAQYVTPWGYKWWLLEPIGPKFLAGVGVMFAFTALITWLGHSYFGKRDL